MRKMYVDKTRGRCLTQVSIIASDVACGASRAFGATALAFDLLVTGHLPVLRAVFEPCGGDVGQAVEASRRARIGGVGLGHG